MKKYVLVVGATPEYSQEIRRYLEDDTTEIIFSVTADDAIYQFSLNKIVLVIMELSYARLESQDLIQTLRRQIPPPILILYAHADIIDRTGGMDAESGDIHNPSDMTEWIIRAKTYMQQHTKPRENGNRAYILAYGQDFVIDPVTRTASLRGETLDISQKQFDLLYFMASHPGQVLSKSQLFDWLWGEPDVEVDNSVTKYISKLRKKLGEDPNAPSYIKTVRGVGYKFAKETDSDKSDNSHKKQA
jgi:DNA-binding response OmpR family regulator